MSDSQLDYLDLLPKIRKQLITHIRAVVGDQEIFVHFQLTYCAPIMRVGPDDEIHTYPVRGVQQRLILQPWRLSEMPTDSLAELLSLLLNHKAIAGKDMTKPPFANEEEAIANAKAGIENGLIVLTLMQAFYLKDLHEGRKPEMMESVFAYVRDRMVALHMTTADGKLTAAGEAAVKLERQ